MAKPSSPFVPVYAGDAVVGRAFELGRNSWAGRMSDGTRVGFHGSLEAAQGAILARHAKTTAARTAAPPVSRPTIGVR
ncbi:hypothetical protein [Methylobacterium sp. Leaf106]|uniref:hypothetical protein n=1 Tax=Methylobacterium sp. Leaf106 TaxID=1736255 RepID=UPI0012E962F9|nr:hypothetical protein [Methylobacterium sp. Leaf106]